MTEPDVRQLVREAIARRALTAQQATAAPFAALSSPPGGHSHGLFTMLPPTDDGSCVIEPAVPCTHCGYCQSMGH